MLNTKPLAARMRPKNLEEFVGQQHLLAPGKPLYQAVTEGHLHAMILWGPPGVGKTTLAHILAAGVDAEFRELSAVLAGVKDIRAVVDEAKTLLLQGRRTVLFVDEVHRFNKAQQDAFLPHVEAGTIIFIGATTENPSFQLNNALLSRARVYVLQALTQTDLSGLLDRVLSDSHHGLGTYRIVLSDYQRQLLLQAADGDARQLLNSLEILSDTLTNTVGDAVIDDACLENVLSTCLRRFDHGGDDFYDQISALHKSVRGSDPDAALYWFCRMLDGGCDPAYLGRRLLRMASEDIGNADPRALDICLNAWAGYERLGSPEGDLLLGQAVVYLAVAAKSNAHYLAMKAASADVKQYGSLPVPLHLRNAPTALMKELGHGRGYRYAHDEPDALAAGETYLPANLKGHRYYFPVPRGLEIKIAEKLEKIRKLADNVP